MTTGFLVKQIAKDFKRRGLTSMRGIGIIWGIKTLAYSSWERRGGAESVFVFFF